VWAARRIRNGKPALAHWIGIVETVLAKGKVLAPLLSTEAMVGQFDIGRLAPSRLFEETDGTAVCLNGGIPPAPKQLLGKDSLNLRNASSDLRYSKLWQHSLALSERL
jgi:hypothetical protein